jgi:Ca2+-binding RTX toxin-like protein
MPTAHYYEQSFYEFPWQYVVDVNSPLTIIPLNLLSPDLEGFAFENVDGTHTVWLGEDVALGWPDGIVSGTVQVVFRLSSLDSLDLDNTIARVSGSYNAIDIYNAYHSGGDAFLLTLFGGDVHFEIDSPASLGALGQSPPIETYYGDDVVFGSIYADTIIAGQGDDEVHGDRGNDTIHGYAGRDYLYGGRGRDDIFGGAGNDVIEGGDGADWIEGDEGHDSIQGNGGDDTILGGSDDDTIHGGTGSDHLMGGDGGDHLSGGQDSAADTLEGGDGNDVLLGGGGADVLRGGASAGGSNLDILDGGDGSDLLYGDDGTDLIVAGRGDDVIFNGHGDDNVHGDAGFDTVVYDRPREDYSLQLYDNGAVVSDFMGNGGIDSLFDVEMILFTDDLILL